MTSRVGGTYTREVPTPKENHRGAARADAMNTNSANVQPKTALVWGLGSGLHLRPLLSRNLRVFVFPIDVEVADLERIHHSFTKDIKILDAISSGLLEIIWEPVQNQLTRYSELSSTLRSAETEIVIHLPALVSVPDAARPVAAMLERMDRERRRSPRIEARLRANTHANLPALAASFGIEVLSAQPATCPVVVVGGGPGLNLAADLLKSAMEVCEIVAVDTALPVLRRSGVEPDVIATIDPHALSARHADLVPALEVPGHLAIQPSAAPELLAQFRQPFLLAAPEHDRLGELMQRRLGIPIVAASGTVLTFALEVARRRKPAAIYLIGADFAFVGGLTHASGTAHVRPADFHSVSVESWSGNKVDSSIALQAFLDALEFSIGEIQKDGDAPKIHALDAGGARIKGALAMSRREFADRLAALPSRQKSLALGRRSHADIQARLTVLHEILREVQDEKESA
jgi:hypothetical protein